MAETVIQAWPGQSVKPSTTDTKVQGIIGIISIISSPATFSGLAATLYGPAEEREKPDCYFFKKLEFFKNKMLFVDVYLLRNTTII